MSAVVVQRVEPIEDRFPGQEVTTLAEWVPSEKDSADDTTVSIYQDEYTGAHLTHLCEFKNHVNEALPDILAAGPSYDGVFVSVICWQDSDRPHYIQESNELYKLFKDKYNFNVEPVFQIPNKEAQTAISSHLTQVVGKASDEDKTNLLIIYYGGHGVYNESSRQCRWRARKPESSVGLNWTKLQVSISFANCDLLFLFDCCHAGAMIDQAVGWNRRCELLGSAGIDELASGKVIGCFTTAIREELESRVGKEDVNIATLHTISSDKDWHAEHELKATPHYRRFLNEKNLSSSIFLRPLNSSTADETDERTAVADDTASSNSSATTLVRKIADASDARVLMKFSFRNPKGKPVLTEWIDWLKARPSDIADIQLDVITEALLREARAKGVALFESESGLVIMSIPIWLWDRLPRHPAYQYLGIVRSDNLLESKPGQPPIPRIIGADYSRTAVQEETPPQIAKRKTPLLALAVERVMKTRRIEKVIAQKEIIQREVAQKEIAQKEIAEKQKFEKQSFDKELDVNTEFEDKLLGVNTGFKFETVNETRLQDKASREVEHSKQMKLREALIEQLVREATETTETRDSLREDKAEIERKKVGLEKERADIEKERADIDKERDLNKAEKERASIWKDTALMERNRADKEKERADMEREKEKALMEKKIADIEEERALMEKKIADIEKERALMKEERAGMERDRERADMERGRADKEKERVYREKGTIDREKTTSNIKSKSLTKRLGLRRPNSVSRPFTPRTSWPDGLEVMDEKSLESFSSKLNDRLSNHKFPFNRADSETPLVHITLRGFDHLAAPSTGGLISSSGGYARKLKRF